MGYLSCQHSIVKTFSFANNNDLFANGYMTSSYPI